MQLVAIDMSEELIDYVVACVYDTINCALSRAPGARSAHARKFTNFVTNVLSRAEVAPPTQLVALAYIARARTHLSIALEEWALERVFLGALIVASKYTQDSTLKNVHWALVTGVFGKRDIGRIEREFIEVLDWQLGVAEADVLAHHAGLVSASSSASWVPAVATKQRPRPHAAVPELEPSSPQSSAGSLSPRTPSHMDIDVHHTYTLSLPLDAAVPTRGRTDATPPKKHARRSLRDLLHAFHPHHHHHHHPVEVAA
jgi:hypothetical protein